MKRLILSMGLLSVAAAALGLTANALNPHRIPLIGNYPKIEYGADSVIVPPDAMEGDPPFITLKDAYGKYHDPGTIFLDARDPADYAAGHVRGAINLFFDELDRYWPEVEPLLRKDAEIVVYCSGTECELSLYEGRYLRDSGYEHIFVFYGGWIEWVNQGYPVDSADTD